MPLHCFNQVGMFLMSLFYAASILVFNGSRLAEGVFWFVCGVLPGLTNCFSNSKHTVLHKQLNPVEKFALFTICTVSLT